MPLLLWTANIELTRGDNRALSLVSLLALAGSFAVLWRLVPASLRRSPAGVLAAGLPVAAFVFTPVAAHCWVMGFSGNQWYLANLAAIAAIAAFRRAEPGGSWTALLPALFVTLPGAFCHSTHLTIWPALLVLALVAPAPRGAVAFSAAASLAFVALFEWGYASRLRHAAPGAGLARHLDFAATYLGRPAAGEAAIARLWGIAGLVLFALALALLLRTPRAERRSASPWFALAVYGGLQAAGTAAARAGLGSQAALASRYASLSALFWLGTLATLALLLARRPPGRLRGGLLAGLGALAAIVIALSYAAGTEMLARHLRRAELQSLGALAVRWNVTDDVAVRNVTILPSQVQSSRAFFQKKRHIPFDDPEAWALGEIPPAAPARRASAAGHWDRIEARPPGFVAVAGRARVTAGRALRVVFLDAGGRLRGAAVFVPDGRTPPPPLHAGRDATDRWAGYLDADWVGRVRPYLEIAGAAGPERARLSVPRTPPLRPAAPALRSGGPPSGTPEDPDS